jgi:hypothetical protein
VTISRDDLYAQVWEKPMMQLASEYGISGNGLAKICRKLAVPYPGRGYWARKAAGQKVSQLRLPDKAEGVPSQVRIAPTLPPPPPPRLAPELEGKLAAARLLTSGITVPAKLQRPHPVIAAWIEERRRRRQEARTDPWRRMSDVPDFSAIDRRRHRFLDALFKTLERHGFKAKTGERGEVCLEVERERVEFELKEKYRQVRRPLTEEEKKWGLKLASRAPPQCTCHAKRRSVTILLPRTRKDPATGWKNILASGQIPGGTTTRSANTIALAAPLSAPRVVAGGRSHLWIACTARWTRAGDLLEPC